MPSTASAVLVGLGARELEKAGVHGGDFEGISVRLDDEGRPSEAVYRVHHEDEWYRRPVDPALTEHRGGEERIPGYVAQGSHATHHVPDAPARGPIPEAFGREAHDARDDLVMLGGQPYAGDDDVRFGSPLPNGSNGVEEPYGRLPGDRFMREDIDDEPGHEDHGNDRYHEIADPVWDAVKRQGRTLGPVLLP